MKVLVNTLLQNFVETFKGLALQYRYSNYTMCMCCCCSFWSITRHSFSFPEKV